MYAGGVFHDDRRALEWPGRNGYGSGTWNWRSDCVTAGRTWRVAGFVRKDRAQLERNRFALLELARLRKRSACDVADADLRGLSRSPSRVRGRKAGYIGQQRRNRRLQRTPAPVAPEAWNKIIGTNLTGVYHTIRAFAPIMIRSGGGHIINISSLAGKNALPNGAAYAASKWGLNGLTVSVAEELRGNNIRVSVVCPGSVHTEFSPHAGKNSSKMLQAGDVAHVVGMLVTQAPQSFVSEVLLRPTMKP